MEEFPTETNIEILLRTDVNDYPHLAVTRKIYYDILNTENFWRMKYDHDGYSSLVFDYFDDQGNLEDYVYSYHRVIHTEKRITNVLMTMVIESKYEHYKDRHIRITKLDYVIEIYIQFLKEKNNDSVRQFLDLFDYNGMTHQFLDIKYKNGYYEFNISGVEDTLFFDQTDTTEFLMLLDKFEGNYLFDQSGLLYVDHVDKSSVIGSRRVGIVATLQYTIK
jgi:hypothetical protein